MMPTLPRLSSRNSQSISINIGTDILATPSMVSMGSSQGAESECSINDLILEGVRIGAYGFVIES